MKRLLQAVLVLLLVSLALFVMLRIVPGNPVAVLMGEHANEATIERLTATIEQLTATIERLKAKGGAA